MKSWIICMLLLITMRGKAQNFVVNTESAQQTIEHFGASDAWSMQNIGLWPEEEAQRQIADWLFSTECDSKGQPLGIGLSLWRFNLGAGSSEQGDSSYINKGTRTECFLQADGSYNWTRQAGQVRFLKMAQERGVPNLLAFLNSPPVHFTENGLATNTGRNGTLNLKPNCYAAFAQFMAEAIKGLKREHGIEIDYLSPVNEPDGSWNWQGPKQEGSPATHREIARVARETSNEFVKQGIKTQIVLDESSDLRCLLGIHNTSWERGNAIASFWGEDSTHTYMGNTPQVPRLMLAHSYWTNTPVPYMKKIREEVRDTCRKYGIKFWQSEICIMSNDKEIGGGAGYDFTMKTGLYVARVIHHDLKYANAESWSWWRACGSNYKDGLIRVYDREHRGKDSKLLWALGNYSRFIRPGAVRYDVDGPEDPYGLMMTAFRNADGKWVCVIINYSHTAHDIQLSFSDKKHRRWQVYRTSDKEGENLMPVGKSDGKEQLPARSIATFVEK